MELYAEDILHAVELLHHLFDDQCVCEDEGAREGVEAGTVLLAGCAGGGAVLVSDLFQVCDWEKYFHEGNLRVPISIQWQR